MSVVLFAPIASAGSPPSNTIPIVADRPNFSEVDLDTFLMLSWHYFDVLQAGDHGAQSVYNKLVGPANQTGMYLCISPSPIQRWGHWPWGWAARMSDNAFSDTTAYARPEWIDITIIIEGDTITFESDTLIEFWSATEFDYSLDSCAAIMDSLFGDEELVWYYSTFDEAPSRQWSHMTDDTSQVDDYIPNMYTQDRDSVGNDSLPTFEEVDPEGVFSWLKHSMEYDYSTQPVVSAFGLLHSFTWGSQPVNYGTFEDQANSIESYLNMEYQGYGNPTLPLAVPNRPELFIFDCYPFRQLGVSWLSSHTSYYNEVSGEQDIVLLEHFEEGMDSTFIIVREVALDQEREIPSLYYPQAFGKCGGSRMWGFTAPPPPIDTLLNYDSYGYRIPTPEEFLMNCNIALMRDIRALIPYCMITYYSLKDGETTYTSGYLDQNNLPLDAPYEEWVYTNRWRSDFEVVPPDSFPPFSDSCRVCGDFDPLWDLPERPNTSGDRSVEDYMMWKFDAYGRLWNSMRSTFGEVATIAPEYTDLHWWEGYADSLEIDSPNDRIEPQIRLFSDEYDNAYAFYVNRNCYDESIHIGVTLRPNKIPFAYNSKLLDHSRRFLMVMENTDDEYSFFRDTLNAGQGRLVQFFGGDLPADIRITEPDIVAGTSRPFKIKDYSFPAESAISISATFYNMGTVGASNVIVHLNDLTDSLVLDTDTLSFSGLDSTGYVCDDQTVTFSWQPNSSDIGVHILEIEAEALTGEPDTNDNSTRVVFQITPRDYARTVLEDSWDMREASGSGAPAWHTNDVVSTSGWNSVYSDSVSGMFEGTVSDVYVSNSLVLNTGGVGDEVRTGLYDQFSMIAKTDCVDDLTVTVHWLNEDSAAHSIELSETIGADWAEMDPFDLDSASSEWASDNAIKLWLEFNGNSKLAPADVRIGWIKLTE